MMRTATTIEASGGGHWGEQVDFVVEAEKLGLDICWVAEAWGSDAPSALGYYAARTDRMLLGSGIMQVGTRTPVAVAQTAITLSDLSDGRFLLGLGASGWKRSTGAQSCPSGRNWARPGRASPGRSTKCPTRSRRSSSFGCVSSRPA
jgi:alkanesulfonate monooxygenase SsuD/methylene tetrahydromethanopterin reductase-like flavin-dependent oxidoreductase (luciferase family)